MSPIYWGVDLIRELERNGTGEAKLAIARNALSDRWTQDRQHATAEELYVAMETAGVNEQTLSKARSLIEHGVTFVPTKPRVHVEDLLPPPPPSPSETQIGSPRVISDSDDGSELGSSTGTADGQQDSAGTSTAATPGAGTPTEHNRKTGRKS
jgi:hypothetical protein